MGKANVRFAQRFRRMGRELGRLFGVGALDRPAANGHEGQNALANFHGLFVGVELVIGAELVNVVAFAQGITHDVFTSSFAEDRPNAALNLAALAVRRGDDGQQVSPRAVQYKGIIARKAISSTISLWYGDIESGERLMRRVIEISESGVIVLPDDVIEALDLKEGDVIVWDVVSSPDREPFVTVRKAA